LYFAEDSELNNFGDAFYVLSQLDLYWANSARNGISVKDAMAQWPAFDTSALELGEAAKVIGDLLLVFVKRHRLSYGEINQYLSHVRGVWVRSQLRTERAKPRKKTMKQEVAFVEKVVG
jgi:hypothetical protein